MKAFGDLKNFVNSCFGNDLKPNYVENIIAFENSFKDLEINVTPKIHAILLPHIDFCEQYKTGLGFFNEQASEAVHYDFKKKISKL